MLGNGCGIPAGAGQEWRGGRIRCILMCSDASAPESWQLHSVTAALREKDTSKEATGMIGFDIACESA